MFFKGGGPGGGTGFIRTPANEIIVNSAADLPPPSGGQRLLANNTTYTLGADVAIDEEIVCAAEGVFRGSDANGATLSTTASRLFVGSNSIYYIRDIRLDCPNGTVFDFVDTAPVNSSILNIRDMDIASCLKIGDFDTLFALVMMNISTASDNGIEFFGSGWFVQSLTNLGMLTSSATFVGIDFGTSVAGTISIDGPIVNGPLGAIGMTGAAASANLVVGGVGSVVNTALNGNAADPLTVINPNDIRWTFRDNAGIPDSRVQADAFSDSPNTTIINDIGVFVNIGNPTNDWASDIAARFTISTAGVVTYIGERDIDVEVVGVATVEKVGGGTDQIAVRVAKDGTSLSKSQSVTENISPTSVTTTAAFIMSTNDTVSLQIANLDSTANIISTAQMQIVGM